jgi:hypothetical protein
MHTPANDSIQAITTYIQEYIDPRGELRRADDAGAVLADLDLLYVDDGGSGLSAEQLQRYLDTLPA